MKGKDLDKIKYILDDENEEINQDSRSKQASIINDDEHTDSDLSYKSVTKKRDQKQKEKEKLKQDLLIYNIINEGD